MSREKKNTRIHNGNTRSEYNGNAWNKNRTQVAPKKGIEIKVLDRFNICSWKETNHLNQCYAIGSGGKGENDFVSIPFGMQEPFNNIAL